MAENFLIVGTAGANLAFGTGAVGYTGVGTIVSSTRKDGGDKLEIKGRQGGVIAVVYFNDKNECELEVIFDSEVTLPVRGDALSVCALTNVLVDEIELKWENEKECMVTIRATRYDNLALA